MRTDDVDAPIIQEQDGGRRPDGRPPQLHQGERPDGPSSTGHPSYPALRQDVTP